MKLSKQPPDIAAMIARLHGVMTYQQIADRIGVSREHVSKIERGLHRPDFATGWAVMRLAESGMVAK